MNIQTKEYITNELLTISEVAALLGVSVAAAMKRAERQGWDAVPKGRMKLYWRGDFEAKDTTTDRYPSI